MKENRREFISRIAVAGMAMPFATAYENLLKTPDGPKFPVRLFSKPLDSYDFGFMCECLRRSGISGFDLTIRPGGKVELANVESDLPKLVDEAKRYDLSIDMMVTGILNASDPYTERVLKAASESGVKYYRLGWYDYGNDPDVWATLQKCRNSMKEVSELNRNYKIYGGYQNHSGLRVGGPVWDLHELLRDLPVEYMGCQYDVYHATVEGANSWIFGLRLIANHIKTFAIKDFTWQTVNGKPTVVTVPLGEGIVDFDLYFKTVKELNISGPITLHIEYPLLGSGEEKLSLTQQQEIIVRKLKKDMDFLKSMLNKHQIV